MCDIIKSVSCTMGGTVKDTVKIIDGVISSIGTIHSKKIKLLTGAALDELKEKRASEVELYGDDISKKIQELLALSSEQPELSLHVKGKIDGGDAMGIIKKLLK